MAHQALNQEMKDLCDIIYDWMKPILYDMKDNPSDQYIDIYIGGFLYE